jgi:hypothetical protein
MSKETNLKIARYFLTEVDMNGFKFFRLPSDMAKQLGFNLTAIDGSTLMFDRSWDWMMPIIELIELEGYYLTLSFYEVVIRKHSEIVLKQSVTTTKLKAVNLIVVRYVKYISNNNS